MREINVLRGRKLSIEGAQHIGSGYCGDVYLIGGDTVVKVMKSTDYKDAEREILLSKWAFRKGLPTAISFDVADVDGHPGLVYESLGRGNLRNELRDHPESFDAVVEKYVALLRKINSIPVEPGELPSALEKNRKELETARAVITPEEYDRAKELLSTVPQNRFLIHGDCQVKNVKVLKGELFLIDLDTLSCGDPIFELSALYSSYRLFNRFNGYPINDFFDLPSCTVDRLIDALLKGYFGDISPEELEKNTRRVALSAYIHMISFCLTDWPDKPEVLEEMLKGFRECLPTVDTLELTY